MHEEHKFLFFALHQHDIGESLNPVNGTRTDIIVKFGCYVTLSAR
jgi:hypothetical protein